MIPDYEISLATTDDVQGMLALQEVNLPDKGGSLSVRLTVDWFNDAILEKSAVVCRYDGKVVGYLMGTSLAANAHIPIIQAMLCAFPRRPTVTFMVRFAWPKASVARASPARCLKNCEHAFPDALPCFSCAQTTRPRSERTRKWGCTTSAHSLMTAFPISP